MIKRKTYLIDKKFQMRISLKIIAIPTAIITIFIIALTSIIIVNNNRMKNIIKTEDTTIHFLTVKPKTDNAELHGEVLKQVRQKHNENKNSLDQLMAINQVMFIIVLAISLIGVFLLFIWLIRITHRISGPIYVMSNHMKSIIKGKKPSIRNIRNNDELQEFYLLFKEMVEKINV